MKKMLTLLAVAALPATLSGCAACFPGTLCPCCPCNWCRRDPPPCPPPVPVCPPPMVAAPVACPPSPCAPAFAQQAMPQQFVMPQQYVMPSAPLAAQSPCSSCQSAVMPQMMPQMMPQQMFAQTQPMYYAEPSCCSSMMMEPSCGGPMPGMAAYPGMMMMDYGMCASGMCDAGGFTAPAPEGFVAPGPAAE